MCSIVNTKHLCQPLVDVARYGNVRVKPYVITTIADIVEDLAANRSSTLSRFVHEYHICIFSKDYYLDM